MCNIAGYAGRENAAPKLIEMLRRQEAFDGDVCCGIVTIHEGRLYMRKVVGTVDTLISTTDALYLPGTVGIAHTRPGGSAETYNFAHPFIAEGGRLAGITNGTTRGEGYAERVQEVTDFLQDNGYEFAGGTRVEKSSFPTLKNGNRISCVEARINLISYYINRGYDIHTAMARVASECYTDSVQGILSLDTPDSIHILRTTRPAFAATDESGTYVASCPFAFPEELAECCEALPILHPCTIRSEGVEVSDVRMSVAEEPREVTDYTLEEGYKRISALLTGKADAPLTFDDLELAVWRDMKDLFMGDGHLIQDARLVYTVLYELEREGKLRREMRHTGTKRRYFMWID